MDLPRRELIQPQLHLGRTLAEDMQHVGLVVLRREADEPAGALQPRQRSLQREVGSAKAHPVHALV